jgi:drug/metabolite transporter (DMT)-like permease
MLWLILAVAAYAFFALSAIGDKYLLSGALPHPVTYAFYVGVLGGLVVLLAPFLGFPVPSLGNIGLALAAGAVFIIALIAYYRALERYEVSRVEPAIGGLLPLATLALCAAVFPGWTLDALHVAAFILFIAASVTATAQNMRAVVSRSLVSAFVAAVLFALAFVLMKAAYLAQSFWSGFLWMRIGGLAFVLLLFAFSPRLRRDAREHTVIAGISGRASPAGGRVPVKTTFLFLGNQGLGAAGGILQNLAIYVAPPLALAFVNALQGVQYVFVIIFAAVISRFAPSIIRESHTRRVVIQRVLAALLLLAGMAVLIAAK